jgi:hypothetical protein
VRRFPKIRKAAGAGWQPRVRAFWAATMVLAALVSLVASPAVGMTRGGGGGTTTKGSAAQYEKDVEDLPGNASPKEACAVLIKHHKVKPAQEDECRKLVAEGFEAAKTVSHDSDLTIHAATACVAQVLEQKKAPGVTKQCAKHVAENEEARRDKEDGGGGGGLFDSAAGFVGGVVDDVTGTVSGAVEGTILDGFNAIIDFLFGGLQAAITVALIKWIITIPNLSGGHVGDLEARIAVGAGGLLAATMTISIVRFWGSGFTGGGAWAGAEGIARAAVAACLIGLWPRIFDLAVRASNALQSGMLNDATEHQLKSLFQNIGKVGFFTAGTVPVFLSIVAAIVGMLMLLALVAMKIIITSLTVILFCAMPLALVLWPIPELSGAAKFCLRSLGVVLAIPVVWCIIFGAFAAIGADTFTFHNTGKDQGIFGTTLNVAIIRPLVAISLLYLALVMPRRLLQLAPFMGGGGGGGIVRGIAMGSALRAGFSYAPKVGGAAAAGMKGMPSERVEVFGSGMEKAAMRAGQRLGGASTSKGAAETMGSKLPTNSQAPQGADPKGGSKNGAADQKDGAKAPGGGGSPAAKRDPNAMALGKAPHYGPRTMQPTIASNEAVGDRSKEMDHRSKSGNAVNSEQAREAVEALHRHHTPERQLELSNGTSVQTGGTRSPELYDAGRRAALGDADQGTGSYAEWSLTDNPHVSQAEKDAYYTLGNASPEVRKEAFKSFEKSQSTSGADQASTPRPALVGASSPSPSRDPHAQPPQGGGQ